MARRLGKLLLFFVLSYSRLAGQTSGISKVWTVKDGLPQSYVSSILQDRAGFLWVATLNGLCRCDGRTFKYFRHTYADSSGVGGNIILYMTDAGDDQLLLCYMDGRMELFHTVTEKVIPLWRDKVFDVLRPEAGFYKSLVRGAGGGFWMMAGDGGVFQLDVRLRSVKHIGLPELGIPDSVLGLSMQHDTLLLFTRERLFFWQSDKQVGSMAYPFVSIRRIRTPGRYVYSPAVRANGDMLLPDADGIRIWNMGTGFHRLVSFSRKEKRGRLIANFDRAGNYFFGLDGDMYVIRPDNMLEKWFVPDVSVKGIITSMYIDRSGVLWAGTNGYGLRQYNLLKTGMRGYENKGSFVVDVFGHYTTGAVPETFLSGSVAFANRCASYKDSVWVADVNRQRPWVELALFADHRISEWRFYNEDGSSGPCQPQFLAFTQAGALWGIDQHFALVRFDMRRRSFRVVGPVGLDPGEELNGMTADGEAAFYITTTRHLVRADTLGHTEQLTSLLPSKELLTVCKDRDDPLALWIGTLSDGLIRLDITTRRTTVFSMATGLPNNTIYSVLQGNDHQLWCSSNKGIFAFNKLLHTVRSFTSRDGLIDDEFNRFYYVDLPNGDMAFGGPFGYTIFNPSKLETDGFNPSVVLTGLNVINLPGADTLLGTLSELHLRHDQNFITAEFAAMQFDFPEKLQYRYMLEGFDKDWILTGNENKVTYTSLPPGSYSLLLNASNTSGKWSSYIRRIRIVISPPFWKTWWFYASMILLFIALVYLFLQLRIRSLKRGHRQQLQFERKAMELQAMALRARMNPHFIFNCLNSIKALIQEREDKKAITYLTSFVTLIRKQLSNTSDRITLQEELDTCRLYLRLEAMRFDGRIAYEFDIAEDVFPERVMVPPLILQPVVENAVVHGLIPLEEGGGVNVCVYREGRFVICSVEDNGIGRAASAAYHASRLHESKGIEMLEERMLIHNRLNGLAGAMETIDLYNSTDEPSGTRVILKFDAEL